MEETDPTRFTFAREGLEAHLGVHCRRDRREHVAFWVASDVACDLGQPRPVELALRPQLRHQLFLVEQKDLGQQAQRAH